MTEKITKVVGAPEEQPGTKIHGEEQKGVEILRKGVTKEVPAPPIEITKGEGDRNE